MNDPTAETVAFVLSGMTYFGGLLIWPAQACIRRRWDRRSKALGLTFAAQLALMLGLMQVTGARLGDSTHHAWWLFLLLNIFSLFASFLIWSATAND